MSEDLVDEEERGSEHTALLPLNVNETCVSKSVTINKLSVRHSNRLELLSNKR